ncbi:hypothetical protein D9758_017991 [Tetrapyrgos nigripes]|uniref:Uncharacterized protein n=1 Tax=Tetrapyrgos nigripes TaxID=182062 RepID=A0A8H5B501_9AGAR|nr:hypothetical protein D9758_017991 [Tetrapyrgos nigripes]
MEAPIIRPTFPSRSVNSTPFFVKYTKTRWSLKYPVQHPSQTSHTSSPSSTVTPPGGSPYAKQARSSFGMAFSKSPGRLSISLRRVSRSGIDVGSSVEDTAGMVGGEIPEFCTGCVRIGAGAWTREGTGFARGIPANISAISSLFFSEPLDKPVALELTTHLRGHCSSTQKDKLVLEQVVL